MTLLMFAIALAQNPVVMAPRGLPPSRWNLSTQADCGRRRLQISGYGVSVYTGATPRVTFEGRPLRGAKVAQLIADLSEIEAVYRFSVQCERTGELTLSISEGKLQRDGSVHYRAGLATIKAGKLDFYSGLDPADTESFWFR